VFLKPGRIRESDDMPVVHGVRDSGVFQRNPDLCTVALILMEKYPFGHPANSQEVCQDWLRLLLDHRRCPDHGRAPILELGSEIPGCRLGYVGGLQSIEQLDQLDAPSSSEVDP